jgi:hypothetical protein
MKYIKMEKINATLLFEMLGRPKEHLVETMDSLIKAISTEKGATLIEKKIHEVKEVEQKEEIIAPGQIFSTFSELEIETDNLVTLMNLCFKYMPAHLEVIKPERINIENITLNSIFNELLGRLHHYDAIAKSALMNNQALASKLKELSDSKEKQVENRALPLEVSFGKEDNKDSKKSKKKRI